MTDSVFPVMAVMAVSLTWPATAGGGEGIPLRVENAWIRAAPPGVSVLAGYMTLINESEKDMVIIGAGSAGFRMIEMHRSESESGMARMVEQDTLTVPAHGRLMLEPNGLHLMLMMPTVAVKTGDAVILVLQLEDGQSIGVKASVRTHGGN